MKRNHQFYFQVQQQLNITKLKYCDFVVFAFNANNQPVFYQERIYPDWALWQSVQPKLTKFWRICILPGVLGRWYTRKCHMPSQMQVPAVCNDNSICYCRKATEEETTTCSNSKCSLIKFHLSRLGISDQVPKMWYCPTCRFLPEFKKSAKTTNAAEQDTCNKALHQDSISICNSKPKSGDRLLECHSKDYLNGISDQVPKMWYCPTCRFLPEFKKSAKTTNAAEQDTCNKALHQDSISICNSKPKSGDRLLECHSKDCLNGKFFHLGCLNCKRIPNNSKSTWICNSCKGKPHKENDVSISTAKASQPITTPSTECHSSKSKSLNQSTTCTSSSPQDFTCSDDDNNVHDPSDIDNSDNELSDDQSDSDDDVEITNVTRGNTDKTTCLGNLTQADYDSIESPTGWLDCTIIQQAQILLKQVNPLFEGIQRTTLGPVRNFDVVTSEWQ